MCDENGLYIFKNGNEYLGGIQSAKKPVSGGSCHFLDGPGQMKIAGHGTFIGNFSCGLANGKAKVETLTGRMIDLPDTLTNARLHDVQTIVEQACQKYRVKAAAPIDAY